LPETVTWPIAELTIRYLRSAEYPGSLTVDLAPIHVGLTSFMPGHGIFDRDGCVAVALNRSVCVDRATGRKVPIQDTVAARPRELSRPG
jgi:acyl-CoA thioesterase FadM